MRAVGAWLSTGSLGESATPSTWSLSAVSVAVSARAVGRGGWPKVPPLLVDEVLPGTTHASVGVELPAQLRFLFGVVCGEGAESYAKALASDILR